MFHAGSSIEAPFGSSIIGETDGAVRVVEVERASNWAETAGAPLTVVFPLKPASFKVAIISSTDLFKRSRCSEYDGEVSPELLEASFAGNSAWTLATASLIAAFCSSFWWVEAYFSAIWFNKAASEAFCSKIALSSDATALSTTSDELATEVFVSVAVSFWGAETSLEASSVNEVASVETDGALTAVEEETTSFPTSSAKVVFATVVALKRAAANTIPFNKWWLLVETASSRTSATTVSSTWPRITLSKPKFEVAARNQFLPDLINLKRVTRSVSRNSPFERLKIIWFSFF